MNLEAVDVKILERRDDGSGVVEIPMLPATVIDNAMTAGGGKGKTEITVDDLLAMCANFKASGVPVPVGVSPHMPFGDRASASLAFLEGCRVKGGVLFGTVWLSAPLFGEVQAGHWRGFSVEMVRDMVTATRKFVGWVLTGGVFTNRPATEVNFRIAAEGDPQHESATYTVALRNTMGENTPTVADLQATLTTRDALLEDARKESAQLGQTVADLKKTHDATEGRAITAENENKALSSRLESIEKTLKEDRESKSELQTSLEAEQNKNLAIQIRTIVGEAIGDGAKPAAFDGCADDPLKFFNSRFKNLDGLKLYCDNVERVGLRTDTKSGRPLAANDTEAFLSALDPKLREIFETTLEDANLELAYSTCNSAREARKITNELAAKGKD